MAGVFGERLTVAIGDRQRQARYSAPHGVGKNCVDELQSFGHGVLDGPAAQGEETFWRGEAPELGPAHPAGITERFDMRWLTIGRITA
jgi:hypothetical protein